MDMQELHKQFDLFNNMYRALKGVTASLPFDDVLRGKVAHFIDTGFLWAKEGFQAAMLARQEAKEPSVLAEQPKEEVKAEEKPLDAPQGE